MTPVEAKLDLEHRLAAAGFRFDAPNHELAWRAFREHLSVPVQGARDFVLVDSGVFEFDFQPLRPAFIIDLCRQFGYYDEEDEFEGYEQLHLILYYLPDAVTPERQLSEYWEPGMPRDQLFDAVESSEAFQRVAAATCQAALIIQWKV